VSWVKDPDALRVLRQRLLKARASLKSLVKSSRKVAASQRLEVARAILQELRVVVKLEHALSERDSIDQTPHINALLRLTEDWAFTRRDYGD